MRVCVLARLRANSYIAEVEYMPFIGVGLFRRASQCPSFKVIDFSRISLQTGEQCIKLRRVYQTEKLDRVEVRAVIKYFCKTGMKL